MLRRDIFIQIFDLDADLDFHRAVADEDERTRAGHEVADLDGQMELQLIHTRRHDVAACIFPRGRIGCSVHHLHDIATIDIATGIRLIRHHDAADDCLSFHSSALHSYYLLLYIH